MIYEFYALQGFEGFSDRTEFTSYALPWTSGLLTFSTQSLEVLTVCT